MKPPGNSYYALVNLVSVLNSRETKYLQRKVFKIGSRKEGASGKSDALFELLLSEPDVSVGQLVSQIYQRKENKALKHLRIRLFNKLIFSLGQTNAFVDNCENSQLHSALRAIQVLWQRGAYQALDAALPMVYRLASKLEDFEAQSQLLQCAIRLASLREEDCSDLIQELNQIKILRDAEQELRLESFPTIPGGLKPISGTCLDLARKCLTLDSARIKFQCLLIEGMYNLDQGTSELALPICAQIFHLLARNSGMFDSNAHLQAKCLAAAISIQLNDPHQALSILNDIETIPNESEIYFWQALQLKAEALSLSNNPKLGYALFRKLLESSKQEPSKIRNECRYFLAAETALLANMPLQILHLLGKVSKVLLLDVKWNLSFRLLQIQALLMTQQYDHAELRIEAMRKHLGKLKGESALANWYQTVLRIMLRLVRSNFVYFNLSDEEIVALEPSKLPSNLVYRQNLDFAKWWQGQLD